MDNKVEDQSVAVNISPKIEIDGIGATKYRNYGFDWLRVIGVAGVFLVHNAFWLRFINQPELSDAIFATMLVVWSLWVMPLMFFVGGSAGFWSLSTRDSSLYLRTRVTRLLVPLAFGAIFITPVQVYLQLYVAPYSSVGSFIDFIPRYFEVQHWSSGGFIWWLSHLWFLLVMVAFTLITVPLFILLKSKYSERLRSLLVDFLTKPGALFVWGIPIAVSEACMDPKGFGIGDVIGWNIIAYLWLFISGYILVSDRRIEQVVRRNGILALGIAALAIEAISLSTPLYFQPDRGILFPRPNFGTLWFVLFMTLKGVASWCFVLGLVGLAYRIPNCASQILRYSNEACLPFYIIHLPIVMIVCINLVVLQIDWFPKLLIAMVISFTGTMFIYELIVRRILVFRFLLGLRT
jgi:glucans biosynthesis protein C